MQPDLIAVFMRCKKLRSAFCHGDSFREIVVQDAVQRVHFSRELREWAFHRSPSNSAEVTRWHGARGSFAARPFFRRPVLTGTDFPNNQV
jgi:hypothetical protein